MLPDRSPLPAARSTQWLGATLDKEKGGTNFVIYAGKDARSVQLCLFDQAKGADEKHRFQLVEKKPVTNDKGEMIGHLWHGFAEGIGEGQMYGFRIAGPYHPELGQFFNPNKLLVDPAAKAVTDDLVWDETLRYSNMENDGRLKPKARVVDWQKLQEQASTETLPLGCLLPHGSGVISEIHVKGATKLHPDIAEKKRGTYSGLADPAFISWLKEQGITTLELMPVAAHGDDYWGYSPMAGMAPHAGYASTDRPEVEFMETVRTLKENGIEVIMDVVPNHSVEGGAGAATYFREADSSLYAQRDVSGCGNTKNFDHPINRRLFLEELKYWRKAGVAGFRIDMVAPLGRENGSGMFHTDSLMLEALRNDPELADIKLFCEPWDMNDYFPGQLGRGKGNHLAEWNEAFHKVVPTAAFNTEHDLPRSMLIEAIAGSDGRFFSDGSSQRIVNYIFPHDGPTMYDAVSAQFGKNNHANGHGNIDGPDIPRNWYWGDEADRWRVQRFAAALLAITQGNILMTLGSERGHSQNYNTNPYKHDDDAIKPKWGKDISPQGLDLMNFVGSANRLRNAHPVFSRGTYFTGGHDPACDLKFHGEPLKDVTWLDPAAGILEGDAMRWPGGFSMLLSGDPGNSPEGETSHVRKVTNPHGDPILVLINPTRADMPFTLPDVPGIKWKPALNSLGLDPDNTPREGNQTINVGWRSVMVFEAQREQEISRAI